MVIPIKRSTSSTPVKGQFSPIKAKRSVSKPEFPPVPKKEDDFVFFSEKEFDQILEADRSSFMDDTESDNESDSGSSLSISSNYDEDANTRVPRSNSMPNISERLAPLPSTKSKSEGTNVHSRSSSACLLPDTSDIFVDKSLFVNKKEYTSFIQKAQEIVSQECKHEKCVNVNNKRICKACGQEKICNHDNKQEEDGREVCMDCGQEFLFMTFDPEWRYYGDADNRTKKDPSRCHIIKAQTRNIDDVVAKLELPTAIKAQTEQKYLQVVGKETVRGVGRRSIVAACLFHVYMERDDHRTSDEIRNMFHLTQRSLSMGLTKYYSVFKEDRQKMIRPKDLIKRILRSTGIPESHYSKILKLNNILENCSSSMTRSCPQAISAAVVYLYLCLFPSLREKYDLHKMRFAQKVGLSDITITRITNECSVLLKDYLS